MSVLQTVPEKIVAITPHASTDFTGIRALRVGTLAGDISVRNMEGTTVVIPSVQVGETVLTGKIDRIFATGTTATGITGYYCQ